jgi:geranylgeranyl diphosphate synthase type II
MFLSNEELQERIEQLLRMQFEECEGGDPVLCRFVQELSTAHLHPLLAGGKRIRPKIVVLMATALGGATAMELALPSAIALELVHTYSLVHDDLPCMDDDDLRRGKPTTHKVFGEAKALLVGDGLLTQAFQVLSSNSRGGNGETHVLRSIVASEAVFLLSQAAGSSGMVLGQWIDMSSFSDDEKNSWDLQKGIANLKTGALLGAAFELGVIAGVASVLKSPQTMYSEKVEKLRRAARLCGEKVGLAFQIVDDVLDETSSAQQMGKTVGKDARQEKLTAVRLWGIERARLLAAAETEAALALFDEVFRLGVEVTGVGLCTASSSALLGMVRELLVRQS